MAGRRKDRSTDNVLADLGFRDAEELTAKAILAKKINDIVESRGLTQSDAAKLLGIAQPKISAIRNYASGHFSGAPHAGADIAWAARGDRRQPMRPGYAGSYRRRCVKQRKSRSVSFHQLGRATACARGDNVPKH